MINSNNTLLVLLFGSTLLVALFGMLNIQFPVMLVVYCVVVLMLIIAVVCSNNCVVPLQANLNKIIFYIISAIIVSYYVVTSVSESQSYDKLLQIIYLIVAKIFLLTFINYRYLVANYVNFLISFKFTSIAILFLYIVLFVSGYTENIGHREYLKGTTHPIWFGRIVADFAFAIIFINSMRRAYDPLSVAALLISVYLMFQSGSRGPMISLVLTVGLFYAMSYRSKYKTPTYLFALGVVAFVSPFTVESILNTNIYSVFERLKLLSISFTLLSDNLTGYGIGSFGLLATGSDVRMYPHNIFLEILLEMGLAGLLVFTVLIAYGLLSFNRDNIFYYLFIMALINAQVSGDLSGNSTLFVYLYLSIIFKRYSRYRGEFFNICTNKACLS